MADRVSAGQSVFSNRFFRDANFINRASQAVEAYHATLLGEGLQRHQGGPPSDNQIKIKNSTGGPRALGDVITIGDYILDELDPRNLWFDGVEEPVTSTPRFAILARAAGLNDIVPAFINGVCVAKVSVSSLAHTHAAPGSGNWGLYSAPAGPLEFLSRPASIEEQLVAVRFNHAVGALAKNGGTAIPARSGTTPGSSTVTLYYRDGTTLTSSGQTVTAYNMAGSAVAADAYLQMKFINGDWWVDVEDCGA